MCDRVGELLLKRQKSMFRLAERDHELTRKAISMESGIHYDTLGTYIRCEAPLPLAAVLKLVDVIPDYLLSQLFEVVGRRIDVVESGDGDLDALGREAAGFAADYVNATSGGKVTPIDQARLGQKALRLALAAGKVRLS